MNVKAIIREKTNEMGTFGVITSKDLAKYIGHEIEIKENKIWTISNERKD